MKPRQEENPTRGFKGMIPVPQTVLFGTPQPIISTEGNQQVAASLRRGFLEQILTLLGSDTVDAIGTFVDSPEFCSTFLGDIELAPPDLGAEPSFHIASKALRGIGQLALFIFVKNPTDSRRSRVARYLGLEAIMPLLRTPLSCCGSPSLRRGRRLVGRWLF